MTRWCSSAACILLVSASCVSMRAGVWQETDDRGTIMSGSGSLSRRNTHRCTESEREEQNGEQLERTPIDVAGSCGTMVTGSGSLCAREKHMVK